MRYGDKNGVVSSVSADADNDDDDDGDGGDVDDVVVMVVDGDSFGLPERFDMRKMNRFRWVTKKRK
ncbi:hypothetical protein LOAG_17008 [Loa loa]|uniref:Uncharacterized protein n=1 Tax=Loa loa TaxID=7209 RepID=A0A1I7VMD3_LOALO|nr:hypothetical protein LOAG_17008 [Loa loa]EJD75924.1 hypothetical protein LOAG_17008 [Loa loa]